MVELVTGQSRNLAECNFNGNFSDRFLAEILDKIDKGIAELLKKYPGRKKPVIKSGLRGPKYYIEFPIAGRSVDAFGLILTTEKSIQSANKKHGSRIVDTDSYLAGENVSYKIDYSVNSSTVSGGKSKGTVYIRGIKSDTGFDSFKFVLEKNVDFSDLDAEMVIGAVEHLFKI